MKNKQLTSYIQNKHLVRIMGYVALTLLLMIVTSIFLPNHYSATNTGATTKAANPSELTFTSTSSAATVSLDVTDANGSFAASSSNVAFTLSTNNATGYTLNLKSSGNDTALTNNTNASSISSITSATSYSTFSGTSSASRALNNKWGILPSKYNGANNTSNYYPVSSTGFKMDETSAANATANNYTIGLGIRANFDAATGTYANATLVIEYVANPVTYSINYNKNTTATVTGMPSPNPQGGTISQGTTSTSVTLASAPERTGYTFLGWCKGTSSSSNVTTSNGVDTCGNASTSQFEAEQSFGIDATGTSPDTYYLYAMWSANSYTCTKQYRLQNADGTWGEYQSDGTEQIKYDATCSYSKTVANYKGSANATNNSAATTSGVMNSTDGITVSLDLYRNTFTFKVGYKYQNADGSYGSVINVVNTTKRYGETFSWSTADIPNFDSTTYQSSANYTNNNIASNVDQVISVDRNTFTVTKQYRLQGTDGNYPSTYTNDGTVDVLYGASYSYSKAATTTHIAASNSLTNVTSAQTISLDVPRKTVTVTKQYRLQGTDGNYPSTYTNDGTVDVLYGASYTYSKAATTTHIAKSETITNVTSAQTISMSVPRQLVACNKQYKLENADGTWTSYTPDGSVDAYYGGTCSYSKTVTNYRGASNAANGAQGTTSASNVTTTQTLSLDFYRNTFTCLIKYQLQNANGSYATAATAINATKRYGEVCSWSRAADATYKAASYTNNSITANVDQTVNVDRNTFICKISYKYQAANGSYGNATVAVNTTKRYGESCSWSTASISNFDSTTYKSTSYTNNSITADVDQIVSIDRNTFTCLIKYQLQNANGSYATAATGTNSTLRYGETCAWSRAADATYKAASYSTTITADVNQTVSVDRNPVTCNKQYRLENADGSFPTSYTADGSETILYGGSCSYSKTVTDYKGSANGANGSAGTASVDNVTSTQTLSVSLYRNTYTLTVTAGANTSGATGGGSKKWGESVTVGVTKAANTTCVAYATPTWTASTGTAPAAGASSTYTMPKSNATVTASSTASNIAQTITFKTLGATDITLNNNTKTNDETLSITCGSYNITGTFPTNYDFDSWSATAGTFGSNSTLSTTYTVVGDATITLAGKPTRCTSRATCMQTITTCPTGVTEVMDARDGTLYKINSLADGRCWMLDNLAIDLVSTPLSTLSGLTNASYTSLNYLKNGGAHFSTQYAEDPVEYWTSGGGFTTPKIYMADKDVVPRNAPANGSGSNKVGGYYNYCAASAGSYCYHNNSSSGNATEDICPAGWSMPTRNNINSVVGAYNNVYNNIRNAMSLAVTGYYAHLDGTASGQGLQGEYWASTLKSSSDDSMYGMHVNSTSEAFESNMVRYNGGTIRCILQVPTYGP
ncbi:hypothetical protein IKT18_00650 [Candidatus Saccharibacteria bacterium]|nr:hypothetical protein [Candidatus Saccharibacteria bacterium]